MNLASKSHQHRMCQIARVARIVHPLKVKIPRYIQPAATQLLQQLPRAAQMAKILMKMMDATNGMDAEGVKIAEMATTIITIAIIIRKRKLHHRLPDQMTVMHVDQMRDDNRFDNIPIAIYIVILYVIYD